VFNFDVPHHADDYVHRIGRTGRAGKLGTTYMLVTAADDRNLDKVLKLIGQAPEELKLDLDWSQAKDDRRPAGGGRDDRSKGRSSTRDRERPSRGRPASETSTVGMDAVEAPVTAQPRVQTSDRGDAPEGAPEAMSVGGERPRRERGRGRERGRTLREAAPEAAESVIEEAEAVTPVREREERPARGGRGRGREERPREERTVREEPARESQPREERPREERPRRDRDDRPRRDREDRPAARTTEAPGRGDGLNRSSRGGVRPVEHDDDDRRVKGFGSDTPAFLMQAPPRAKPVAED
jgi:superfamily II DNA/RNA helicase